MQPFLPLGSSSFAIADSDDDEFVDLVLTDEVAQPGTIVYRNNARAIDHTGIEIFNSELPCFVVTTDMDGDSDPDLITKNVSEYPYNSSVSVYKKPGDFTFRLQANYPIGEDLLSISTGDLHGDSLQK